MSTNKRMLYDDNVASISSNVNESNYEPSSKRLKSHHDETYKFDISNAADEIIPEYNDHVLTPM